MWSFKHASLFGKELPKSPNGWPSPPAAQNWRHTPRSAALWPRRVRSSGGFHGIFQTGRNTPEVGGSSTNGITSCEMDVSLTKTWNVWCVQICSNTPQGVCWKLGLSWSGGAPHQNDPDPQSSRDKLTVHIFQHSVQACHQYSASTTWLAGSCWHLGLNLMASLGSELSINRTLCRPMQATATSYELAIWQHAEENIAPKSNQNKTNLIRRNPVQSKIPKNTFILQRIRFVLWRLGMEWYGTVW